MKSIRSIISLSLLLIVSASPLLSGCSSTRTQESTGQYIDDSSITAKIKAAFIKDDEVKARDISVQTFKGIVQLNGFVNTPEEKAHAEQLAAAIPGVASVQNNLTVK